MSLFSRILGGGSKAPEPTPGHAVIIHFQYGSTDLSRIFQLEKMLEDAIEASRAGEYDGNEVDVDGSGGRLFMYGPNADRLFEVVRPILEAAEFMRGGKAVLRYGGPGEGVEAKTVILAS